MAWSQYRAVFMSSCHQTVCRYESVCQVGKCAAVYGGLYQLFLVKVKVYCACPCACLFCAAAVSLSAAWRHPGPPRSAPLLSPRLSGRKVLMAAAMPDSLSICCGWHSSFTVTSPRLTALATSALLFQFLPPNLHLIDAIFFPLHELINDLCCGKCELLNSNQSQLNRGIVKQLNYFNYSTQHYKKDCSYSHTKK